MGDLNAVDEANEVHREILLSEGCLHEDQEVKYGYIFPRGPCYEGVYIDDQFEVRVGSRSGCDAAGG